MPLLQKERYDLRQCDHCGQRWHSNILSEEWNEIRFSKWMSEAAIRLFEAQHGTNHNSAAEHVQHVLRLKDLGVKRVLDFGCGFGQFLEMCRLFGLEAVGVDRSIGRRAGSNVRICKSLEEVDGSFDAITLFEVLEHLDEPLDVLWLLKSRLKRGGIMIVEVPDTTGVSRFDSRESYYKIHPLDHINAFTPKSLIKMMSGVGFRQIGKRAAFVTTSPTRAARDAVKAKLKKRTTQCYFRAK